MTAICLDGIGIKEINLKNGRAVARAVRLTQIQHFLHRNPAGLTSRELAELCGVCCRTIQRDLLALQTELNVPLTQHGDRYGILVGYMLPPLSFSLYEAMAIFLAARLALRQTDENNPHIQQALDKIAMVLPPQLGKQLKKGIQSIERKMANPAYIHIFEQIAIAWTTQRQMKIQYRSLQSKEVKEWLLEPYYVEMTGVGYSIYVIGHASRAGKEGIITFKLDRIENVEILEKHFEIPSEFDMSKLLSDSWGIIWGEEVEVKLKFSPNVARRVKESIWHPSQIVEDLPDGGCLFTAKVSSILEMTPWIRGWGPDVEVLEPKALRDDFRAWTRQFNKVYL